MTAAELKAAMKFVDVNLLRQVFGDEGTIPDEFVHQYKIYRAIYNRRNNGPLPVDVLIDIAVRTRSVGALCPSLRDVESFGGITSEQNIEPAAIPDEPEPQPEPEPQRIDDGVEESEEPVGEPGQPPVPRAVGGDPAKWEEGALIMVRTSKHGLKRGKFLKINKAGQVMAQIHNGEKLISVSVMPGNAEPLDTTPLPDKPPVLR